MRLHGRGTDNEEDLQREMAQAKKELEFSNREVKKLRLVVFDGDLELAYVEVEKLILDQE